MTVDHNEVYLYHSRGRVLIPLCMFTFAQGTQHLQYTRLRYKDTHSYTLREILGTQPS